MIVFKEVRQSLPTLGEAGDELGIGMAVFHQQVQQAVEQGQVAARLDLQEQVGLVGSGIAPWIDHDQPGAGLEPVHQAQEQDRVTVGHVGTDHEEQLGLVEILIGARWPVGS